MRTMDWFVLYCSLALSQVVLPRTVLCACGLVTALTADGHQGGAVTSGFLWVLLQLGEYGAEEGAEVFVARGEDSQGTGGFSVLSSTG